MGNILQNFHGFVDARFTTEGLNGHSKLRQNPDSMDRADTLANSGHGKAKVLSPFNSRRTSLEQEHLAGMQVTTLVMVWESCQMDPSSATKVPKSPRVRRRSKLKAFLRPH